MLSFFIYKLYDVLTLSNHIYEFVIDNNFQVLLLPIKNVEFTQVYTTLPQLGKIRAKKKSSVLYVKLFNVKDS